MILYILYSFIVAFFIVYFFNLINYIYNKKSIPKNYKIKSKPYNLRKEFIPNYRNKFNTKKIPENIDTIIIGSGIGGLTCAALLSRVGQKVLVIEQHDVAGGTTHMFDDHGVEHETGVHYIGNINKRNIIFKEIMKNPIEWDKMGKETDGVYDEIVIEDRIYKFRAGENNFINDLVEKFPNEKQSIKNYIEFVKKIAKKDMFFNLKILKPLWLQNILLKYLCKDFYDIVGKTAYDVVSSFTKNEELKAVLLGQFGDYGSNPKENSFFLHASIVNHYLEGGYYPKGGPVEIAKRIIPTIEESGGCVLVGKKVNKILIDSNNNAYGIEMEPMTSTNNIGIVIKANNIVSGAGVRTTYETLLDSKYKKLHGVDILLNTVKPSTTFVYLFINLEGTTKDYDIRDSNIWVWPNRDYENMIKDFCNDPLNPNIPIPMFIASGSAKDSTWTTHHPDKCSVIILTICDYNMFEQWKDQPIKKRDFEYNELKEKFAKRMLEEGLYKFYPKTRDHVLKYEVSTPLTTAHYLNTLYGECYGLDSSMERYTQFGKILRPNTPINNFFLTGQDICTLGVTGAMMGGVLTAHSILGYGTIFDILKNRNLISDLQFMNK